MADLKWLFSYETIKYDTNDGDLHKGQFAFIDGQFHVRTKPENMDAVEVVRALDTTGLTQVGVVAGNTYYDVYELPDGRRYRESSKQKGYKDLALKDAKPKEKALTANEIIKVKEKDSEWQ